MKLTKQEQEQELWDERILITGLLFLISNSYLQFLSPIVFSQCLPIITNVFPSLVKFEPGHKHDRVNAAQWRVDDSQWDHIIPIETEY